MWTSYINYIDKRLLVYLKSEAETEAGCKLCVDIESTISATEACRYMHASCNTVYMHRFGIDISHDSNMRHITARTHGTMPTMRTTPLQPYEIRHT